RNQLADVILVLVAERAAEDVGVAGLLRGHCPFSRLPTISAPAGGVDSGDVPEYSGPTTEYIVDDTVFLRLLCAHDVVAIGVLLDAGDGLSGVLREDLVQPLAHPQDFLRVDVDVGRLAGQARHVRLMDQNPRVRQREPLALR